MKDESVASIWNNEKMVALRDKIVRRDIDDLDTCRSCDRLWREQVLGIPKEYLGRALLKRME